MSEIHTELPQPYIPTAEELEGESVGYCYMGSSFVAPMVPPQVPDADQ